MHEIVKEILMNEKPVEKIKRIIDTKTINSLTPSMIANRALLEIDPDGVTPELVRSLVIKELDKVAEAVLYRKYCRVIKVEVPNDYEELWNQLFETAATLQKAELKALIEQLWVEAKHDTRRGQPPWREQPPWQDTMDSQGNT